MGIRKTAKAGDFKRALEELSEQGCVEGNPSSILNKLGFNGSWKEFQSEIGLPVIKVALGRYALFTPGYEAPRQATDESSVIRPDIFAICAGTYVLGEGDPLDFEPYIGDYSQVKELTAALAVEIDDSIAAVFLPPETDQAIEVYAVERGLYYDTPSAGRFTLYGSAVLANTN